MSPSCLISTPIPLLPLMVEKKKFLLGKSEQRNSCMYVEVLLKRLHLSSNIKGFCPQIKRSVMKLFYLEIRFESRVRWKTPKQVPNSVHSQYRQTCIKRSRFTWGMANWPLTTGLTNLRGYQENNDGQKAKNQYQSCNNLTSQCFYLFLWQKKGSKDH